jgi:hypothetical protein
MVMQAGYTTNPTPTTTTQSLTDGLFSNLQLPATGTPVGTGTVLANGSTTAPVASSIFDGLLSGSNIASALSGLGNYLITEDEIDRLRGIGPQTQELASTLAGQAATQAKFQPYTITSTPGLGQAQVSREGISLETGGPQAEITQQALQGVQTALQGLLAPRQDRETQILEALQTAQEPAINRQRQELEQRLFAQGRGGVQTAMYGGTPEQLAMEQAIQEQQAKNVLSAMTQAGTEQTQAQQLASGLLGTAYTPQAQALNLLQGSVAPQQIATAGDLAGAEAFAKAIPSVIQATGQGETAAANLRQQQLQSLVGLLAPTTSAAIGSQSQQGVGDVIGGYVSSGLEDLYNSIFG